MQTLIKPAEVVNTGIYRPAPVTARFDVNQISPHVQSGEERFIIPILGRDLYLDMIAKQNTLVSNYNPAVGATVPKFPTEPEYETFWVLYLMRYVSYCVFYESLPFITVQVSSKGAYQNDSEFAQNAGVSGVRFLQDNMMQRMDNLKVIIEEYLCKNKALFPLFDAKNCKCDCGDCEVCNGKNSSTNIIFY